MERIAREKWVAADNLAASELLKINLDKSQNKDQLFEILDLNAEQLTYYLEEVILENPFIEIDYALETKVSQINNANLTRFDDKKGTNSSSMAQSLIMFLFEQIMIYRHTPIRDTMVRLVDFLDERGYLPYTHQELALKLDLDEILVLDAVTLFKQLEPAGVGAYDLQECLMIQTEQDPHSPAIAYLLLEEYFDLIVTHDAEKIQALSQFDMEEINRCLNYFHSLRPVPSVIFDRVDKINLIPDVAVRFIGEVLEVRYNRQYYSRIIFNQGYYDEMCNEKDPDLLEYVEYHREKFQILAYNLRIREQFILAAVKALVIKQKDFINGLTNTKVPYLVRDLAKDLNLSESITQLLLTNKNIETKLGIIPIMDLINVTYHEGRGGLNTINIKQIMSEIIESASHELTNQEIVSKLEDKKIIMSEQLVEDYRKAIKN